MSFLSQNCSIATEIASAKETITGLTNRITGLEDVLDHPDLPLEKRKAIENEIIEIRDLLDRNKEQLSKLNHENTKTFVVASCVMFLLAFIYIVYCMTNNR